MQESTFYQMILQEGEAKGRQEGEAKGRQVGEVMGRAEEARALLKRLGTLRCGQPDSKTQEAMDAVQDVARLELLLERLLKVESWNELLESENEPQGEVE